MLGQFLPYLLRQGWVPFEQLSQFIWVHPEELADRHIPLLQLLLPVLVDHADILQQPVQVLFLLLHLLSPLHVFLVILRRVRVTVALLALLAGLLACVLILLVHFIVELSKDLESPLLRLRVNVLVYYYEWWINIICIYRSPSHS